MTIDFKVPEIRELKPRILVLGVGGAGGNAINGMIESNLQGVEFIAINTDAQDLKLSKAHAKIQLGMNLTKGLGAGSKQDIGQAAADESLNDIVDYIKGSNMVFITAGMGGGTGTGASHVIARAAKELNILTVGVVTLPFFYEGPKRMRRALEGLEELKKHLDTNIIVPNQNLFKIINEKTTFKNSFGLSNDVLKFGVQSVTDLMVRPGLINLDFADVETIMKGMGKAMMGTGEAEGEKRAEDAVNAAVNNPLIDEYSLRGAKGLLVNITAGNDLTTFEVDEIVNKIRAEVDPEAELIFGSIEDETLNGKIRVSIVATALDGQAPETKSVINVVHRIQNRNTGYSDFSNLGRAQSFNFSTTMSGPVTDGANALKLENEVINEAASNVSSSDLIKDLNQTYNEELLSNQESEIETNIENSSMDTHDTSLIDEMSETTEQLSNGLENFGIEEETPELFSSEDESVTQEFTSSENDNNESEEDDLEIPAFLRRQKN